MMINKKQYRITNNKKKLIKVGKKWVVASLFALALLGGTAVVSHASSTQDVKPQTAQTTQVAKPATQSGASQNITQQASQLHSQLMNHQSQNVGATQQPIHHNLGTAPQQPVNHNVGAVQQQPVHRNFGATQRTKGQWASFSYQDFMNNKIVSDYNPSHPIDPSTANNYVKQIPGYTLSMGGNALSGTTVPDATNAKGKTDLSDRDTYSFVYTINNDNKTGKPTGKAFFSKMPQLNHNNDNQNSQKSNQPTKQNTQPEQTRDNTQAKQGRIIIHYIDAQKSDANYGGDIIPSRTITHALNSDPSDPSNIFQNDSDDINGADIQYLYKNKPSDQFKAMSYEKVSNYIHDNDGSINAPIAYSAQNYGLSTANIVSDLDAQSGYGIGNFNLQSKQTVKPFFYEPYDQNVYVYFTRDHSQIKINYSDEKTHQTLAPSKYFSDVTGKPFNEHPYAYSDINGFHLDTRYLDAGFEPNDLTSYPDSEPNEGNHHVIDYSYLDYLPNVDQVDYVDAQNNWLVGQWNSTRPSDMNKKNYDSNFKAFQNDFSNGKYDGLSNGYEVLPKTASDYKNQMIGDVAKDNSQYHYGKFNYRIPVVKKSFIDVKFFDQNVDKNGNHKYLGDHKVFSYENNSFDVNQYSAYIPKGYSADIVDGQPKLSKTVIGYNPPKFLYDNQIMGVYVHQSTPKGTVTVHYSNAKNNQELASDIVTTNYAGKQFNLNNSDYKKINGYVYAGITFGNNVKAYKKGNQDITLSYIKLNHPNHSVGDIDVFYNHNNHLMLYRDFGNYPVGTGFRLSAFRRAGFKIVKGNNVTQFNKGLQSVVLESADPNKTLKRLPKVSKVIGNNTDYINYIDGNKVIATGYSKSGKATKFDSDLLNYGSDFTAKKFDNLPSDYHISSDDFNKYNNYFSEISDGNFGGTQLNIPVLNNAQLGLSRIQVRYLDADANNKTVMTVPVATGKVGFQFNLIAYEDKIPWNYELYDIRNAQYYYGKKDQTVDILLSEVKGCININYIDDNNGNIVKKVPLQAKIDTPFNDFAKYLSIPEGYEYKDVQNSGVDKFDKEDQNINIHMNEEDPAKLTISTLTINVKDGNKVLSSKQLSRPVSTDFDIGNYLDIPSGYQYKGMKGNVDHFDYDNHEIDILVNKVVPAKVYKSNININFIDKNTGKTIKSEKVTEPVSTDFDATSYLSNIPSGYEYTKMSGTTDHFKYTDQTINIYVIKPTATVAKSTVTINYMNNGKVINSTKVTKPVSTDFDISEYLNNLPQGYEYSGIKNNIDHFDYNNHVVDVDLIKVPSRKVAKSTINVNFIDKKSGKVVKTMKATGDVSTDFDAESYLSYLPNNYEYVRMSGTTDHFTYNDQTVNIYMVAEPKRVTPSHNNNNNKPNKPSHHGEVKPAHNNGKKPVTPNKPVIPSHHNNNKPVTPSKPVKPSNHKKIMPKKHNHKTVVPKKNNHRKSNKQNVIYNRNKHIGKVTKRNGKVMITKNGKQLVLSAKTYRKAQAIEVARAKGYRNVQLPQTNESNMSVILALVALGMSAIGFGVDIKHND